MNSQKTSQDLHGRKETLAACPADCSNPPPSFFSPLCKALPSPLGKSKQISVASSECLYLRLLFLHTDGISVRAAKLDIKSSVQKSGSEDELKPAELRSLHVAVHLTDLAGVQTHRLHVGSKGWSQAFCGCCHVTCLFLSTLKPGEWH